MPVYQNSKDNPSFTAGNTKWWSASKSGTKTIEPESLSNNSVPFKWIVAILPAVAVAAVSSSTEVTFVPAVPVFIDATLVPGTIPGPDTSEPTNISASESSVIVVLPLVVSVFTPNSPAVADICLIRKGIPPYSPLFMFSLLLLIYHPPLLF